MSDIGRDFWDAAINMTPAAQKMHSIVSITSPYEESPLELTIFVSCCDEESTIVPTLETVVEALDVAGQTYEIIIIDDDSRDHSAQAVRNFMLEHAQINIVLRINKRNKGLAQNFIDGAFIGCGKYYRLVRGNNSETMETMVDVFRTVGEADILVPYYVSPPDNGMLHRFLSGAYTWLLNMLTGNRINYYNGAHVHLRYNVMRWHSNTMGFSFQADLLCRLLELGFTCKQVPCRALPRTAPDHIVTLKNVLSVLRTVMDIILRRISNRFSKR